MMAAMIMQHALITMAPTFVFAIMDLQEMDLIAQVTNENVILLISIYKVLKWFVLIRNLIKECDYIS